MFFPVHSLDARFPIEFEVDRLFRSAGTGKIWAATLMGLQTMSILAIADTHTHNTSSSIGSPVKILDILIELVCVFECESKTYLATCASSNSKEDGVVLVLA